MDPLRSMAVFACVIDNGSLSGAGRALGLSPAAIGNHVRALEEWLGARLLNRTTRRIALTEVGEIFLERVRRILEETEQAKETAAALHAAPRGVLRVSAPASFGVRVLAPMIADYLIAHPQMTLHVSLNDRFVDLLEEGFDVAIRIGDIPASNLVARRLGSAPFVLCAAPDYLERHGEPRELEDLSGHDCLEYTLRLPRGRWRFTAPDGKAVSVDVSGRLQATNGELLRVAALKGLGLTLAPSFIVESDLGAGTLIPVLTTFRPPAPAIHAVHASGRNATAKLRSFVEHLAVTLRKSGSTRLR
jgi:DNA-binding transcriptional LysR family regulator